MPLLFDPPPPIVAATGEGPGFPVRRLFCIGRNYAAHARELGNDDREPPFFFTKWAEAVVPDGATLAYPDETADYHHEAELVVAIGQAGRAIPRKAALGHVYGYACGLDMTRRDLQNAAKAKGRPWDAAKNVAQSAPLGRIHAVSEVGHLEAGAIALRVNGEIRQQGDLADRIWDTAEVIAYVSRFSRLEPGDLIYTGTPAGVGPVVPGDEIEVTIAGLSALTVRIGPAQKD